MNRIVINILNVRRLLDIRLLPWLCAAPLLVLVLVLTWQGYFEDGAGDIRVAVPREFSSDAAWSPFGPGFEHELVERFAARNGLRVVWIPVDSANEAVRLLDRNKADVWIGMGETPIRDGRHGRDLNESPVYANSPLLLLQRLDPGAENATGACPAAISGPVLHYPGRIPPLRVNDRDCSYQASGHAPAWSLIPLLERIESGATPLAIVDERKFVPLRPFFPKVRETQRLGSSLAYRWYWNDTRKDLARKLELFWREIVNSGELDGLNERYYGFFPDEEDYYQLDDLLDAVREDLPKYAKTLAAAGKKADISPLFLAALIYHESGFDPQAVSRTGVRGLMQLSGVTRQELGAEDAGPKGEIMAGARYLRQLRDKLADSDARPAGPWEAWFMTLAAFNQGYGHLRDALRLAEDQDQDPATWAGLKKVYPLLANPRYLGRARNGYCRGYEAVDLVDRVRYFYFLLNGLVFLARPEAEHLAALADPAFPGSGSGSAGNVRQ